MGAENSVDKGKIEISDAIKSPFDTPQPPTKINSPTINAAGTPRERLERLTRPQDLTLDKNRATAGIKNIEQHITSPGESGVLDFTTNEEGRADYRYEQTTLQSIEEILQESLPTDQSGGGNIYTELAPTLTFTETQTGKIPTQESLKKRTDFYRAAAITLITSAMQEGASLPVEDPDTGELLPLFCAQTLKAAIDFLKTQPHNRNEGADGPRDATQIRKILEFALQKQQDPQEAAKWRPGGLNFDVATGAFTHPRVNGFTKQEVADMFNQMFEAKKSLENEVEQRR